MDRGRRIGHWRLAKLAFSGCVLACGPSVSDAVDEGGSSGGSTTAVGETSTSTGAQGSTSSTSEAEPPMGCGCLEVTQSSVCDEVSPIQCDLQELCPTVTYDCPRPNPDFYPCRNDYVYDEVALTCSLEALRDRQIGLLRITGPNDICGFEGCGEDQWDIAITAPDQAVLTNCSADPLSAGADASLRQLAAPTHFEDCLELQAAAERHQCLLDGLLDPIVVCE